MQLENGVYWHVAEEPLIARSWIETSKAAPFDPSQMLLIRLTSAEHNGTTNTS